MVCFHSKDRKLLFLGLLHVYFVQLGQNISNKFNFWGEIFESHFSKFLSSLGCILKSFVVSKPYIKIFVDSGSEFFSFLCSRAIEMKFCVQSGMSRMRCRIHSN